MNHKPKNPLAVALGKLGGIPKGYQYSPAEKARRAAQLATVRGKKKQDNQIPLDNP